MSLAVMSIKLVIFFLAVAVCAVPSFTEYSYHINSRGKNLSIFDGNKSDITEHSYAVGIIVHGDFYCAGIILSKQWVITSAPCVRYHDVNTIQIVAGSNNGEDNGTTYEVKNVVCHPKYTGMLDFSYGLVQIVRKFKWSHKVKPIKLAKKLPKDGTKMTVAGWGFTRPLEGQENNEQMRQGMMNWYNIETCKSMSTEPWTPRMACAYNKGKTTLCDHDVGDAFTKKNVLYGYLSILIREDMCTPQAKPQILTNVVAEGRWIKRITGAKFEDE